jgi:hypothetical protein
VVQYSAHKSPPLVPVLSQMISNNERINCRVTQERVLRKYLNTQRTGCRKLNNTRLYNFYSSPDIIEMIRLKCMG